MKNIITTFVIFIGIYFNVKSQCISFYEYDNALDDYYVNKSYSSLLKNLQAIDNKKILPSQIFEFCTIALNNHDTVNFLLSIEYISYNYGFDYREHASSYIDILHSPLYIKNIIKLDSLLSIWKYRNQNNIETNNLLDNFIAAEHAIYQHQSQFDSSIFSKKMDSLFNILLQICLLQGCYPNTFDNGYKYDISIQTAHILSMSPSTIIHKSKKLKPFLDKSFFANKIPNSCYFIIDRLIYKYYKKQLFGSLDVNIGMIDKQDDIDSIKSKFLFKENVLASKINKKWIQFYDTN